MATETVTGVTDEEVEQLREQYEQKHEDRYGTPDFEDAYCLSPIPHQPDDYDGPQRYCTQRNTRPVGSEWRCPLHGGALSSHVHMDTKLEDFDGSDSMKHGMHATQEHLIQDFDDKDHALYNWVLREYPKAYDIELEDDPASQYDLHRLAVEIVRAERGRGFLIEEGEQHEKEVRDDEGRVVLDETGDVVTEKSEHYLSQMLQRQDKKITRLEKELGITRKERRKHDQTDDAVDAIKSFAQVGADLLDRDSKDYDPDADKAWESSDSNDSD